MKKIKKPWGYEIWLAHTKRYLGKIILIRKGHRLSRQYHRLKQETLYTDRGRYIMEIGNKKRIIKETESLTINPGIVHRMHAKFGDVRLIEVSTPHPKDVVRIEDDYGRADKNKIRD